MFSGPKGLDNSYDQLHVEHSSISFVKYFYYAPGSNDRGHIVFVLSVCLFVFFSCLFVCLSVVNFNLHSNI